MKAFATISVVLVVPAPKDWGIHIETFSPKENKRNWHVIKPELICSSHLPPKIYCVASRWYVKDIRPWPIARFFIWLAQECKNQSPSYATRNYTSNAIFNEKINSTYCHQDEAHTSDCHRQQLINTLRMSSPANKRVNEIQNNALLQVSAPVPLVKCHGTWTIYFDYSHWIRDFHA